jgi:hypothetical protein
MVMENLDTDKIKAVKTILQKSKDDSIDICMMAWNAYGNYSLEQLDQLISEEQTKNPNSKLLIAMTVAKIMKERE